MTFFGRYSDDDRDEFTPWCRTCNLPRSLHGGVRLCAVCDGMELAPGSEYEDLCITDEDLLPPA